VTLPRTEPAHHRRSIASGGRGGPDGNERLTTLTGAVLLILFAAEGLTLLQLGRLLYWHYLLGFPPIGPVCLKVGSTVYRFPLLHAPGAVRAQGTDPARTADHRALHRALDHRAPGHRRPTGAGEAAREVFRLPPNRSRFHGARIPAIANPHLASMRACNHRQRVAGLRLRRRRWAPSCCHARDFRCHTVRGCDGGEPTDQSPFEPRPTADTP
jgi:hypothetical protein